MSEYLTAVICGNPDDPVSVLTTEAVNRALAGIDVPADIPLDAWRIAEASWSAIAGAAEPGEVFSNIEVAARAVMAERARAVQAVISAPSLDENGHVCEKSAVLATLTHPVQSSSSPPKPTDLPPPA